MTGPQPAKHTYTNVLKTSPEEILKETSLIRKLLTKQEIKNLKSKVKRYMNMQYVPKHTKEEQQNLKNEINGTFYNIRSSLTILQYIQTKKIKGKLTCLDFSDETIQDRIIIIYKRYNKIRGKMIDYIKKYKSVSRGKWANCDIIQNNFYKMKNAGFNCKYNTIKTCSKRILSYLNKTYTLWIDLINYYEANRLKHYRKRKHTLRDDILNYEKLIFEKYFILLVAPIYKIVEKSPENVKKEFLDNAKKHLKETFKDSFRILFNFLKVLRNSGQINFEHFNKIYFNKI